MKTIKFLQVATVAVSAVIGLNFYFFDEVMDQEFLYDQKIVKPLEKIPYFKSEMKSRHESYVKQDLEFLENQVKDYPAIKDLFNIKVLVKEHTVADAIFRPGMELFKILLHHDNKSQYEIEDVMKTYRGEGFYYAPASKYKPEAHIMFGINALKMDEDSIFNESRKIWNNEQMVSSFLFFHELAHHASKTLLNEKEIVDTLIEQQESDMGIKFDEQAKLVLFIQYREAFADKFAIQMQRLRYPQLDIEEKIKNLGKARTRNIESHAGHVSWFGLTIYKEMGNTMPSILEHCANAASFNLMAITTSIKDLLNDNEKVVDFDVLVANIEDLKRMVESGEAKFNYTITNKPTARQ